MGSQPPKKAHKSQKKNKFFIKFTKNIYEWAPQPIPKLHNIPIVGTRALKSNHISYTTVKPHEPTNIYKLGHNENQQQN